ncbi:Protein ASPARTIC PROTEASE IN GUARD CELL 1 [Dendrobium catenatum]|uniref:Protein ASPARTIC PROTEASE IN GUARD CELL 1 n=1 Tax=Dendrobium catenatum TaxID=906689 RepID=A0A2I0XAN4_9ASPA|nr:Protein ASPARTIC PROTEASE IN GUARD CELL 1 [Dendrobium catenatum]
MFLPYTAIINLQLQHNSSGIRLPLHHPQSPCSPSPLSSDLPFSDILHHDSTRVNSLLHRVTTSAASIPLFKGTALGTSNYVTRINIGTPSKPYTVEIDTGSSLPWLQCLPCKRYCHRQLDPIFNPAASSTYRTIPCSAAYCSALLSATLYPSGCDSSHTCTYEAGYGDGSLSFGYLSQDTLSLSRSVAAFPKFIFGCGQNNKGLYGESAGIFGLAKNSISLFSQISPKFGSSFSYCLSSRSATGYLSFGGYNPGKFVFTPMTKSSADESLYSLKLSSIAVETQSITVSEESPSIIDSGTVITRLPEEVYSAVRAAVVRAIGGKVARAPAYSLFDTCYKGSAAEVPTPEVAFVFGGGAVLRLPGSNVMFDVHSGVSCLAFAAAKGVTIIGNWQQKTFDVVYDVGKGRIGFAGGGCG